MSEKRHPIRRAARPGVRFLLIAAAITAAITAAPGIDSADHGYDGYEPYGNFRDYPRFQGYSNRDGHRLRRFDRRSIPGLPFGVDRYEENPARIYRNPLYEFEGDPSPTFRNPLYENGTQRDFEIPGSDTATGKP